MHYVVFISEDINTTIMFLVAGTLSSSLLGHKSQQKMATACSQ